MKLSTIITELRRRCPSFEKRVYGVAEWAAREKVNLPMPSAYVLPLGESADLVSMTTDYRQHVEQSFGVAVLISTKLDDPTGLQAFDKSEDVKAEIFRAIVGWETDETDAVIYEGSTVLELNRAFLCVQFEFSVSYDITDADTRHGAMLDELTPFDGVDMDVDLMKPDGSIDAKVTINLE